jgi:hypothetical protein
MRKSLASALLYIQYQSNESPSIVRITIHEAENAVTLKIEGRAVEPLVAELHRAWRDLAISLGPRKLSIDLRGVTFMDRTGRHLLAEIHAKTGAEFLADTPMTKHFANEAIQANRTNS